MPYSKVPIAELNSRLAHLKSLLMQPHLCSLREVDLELHKVELELQNRELKNALMELEASRAAYAELFDSAPFGYLVLDRQGAIADVNLPAARMLRRRRDELLGKPFAVYITAGNAKRFLDYLRDCHVSPWITLDLRPPGLEGAAVPVQLFAACDKGLDDYRIAMQPLADRTCEY